MGFYSYKHTHETFISEKQPNTLVKQKKVTLSLLVLRKYESNTIGCFSEENHHMDAYKCMNV